MDIHDIEQIDKLLSLLLYAHKAGRAADEVLAANRLGQPGLWGYGISGDFPILLVQIGDESEGELLQKLLIAHKYWRRRGVQIDLVIANQQEVNYGENVRGFIMRLISRLGSDKWLNQRGGIFVVHCDKMPHADYTLLQAAARVVMSDALGSLDDQLAHVLDPSQWLPNLITTLAPGDIVEPTPPIARPQDLQFDNGLGGFSPDGAEYVIYLRPGETTPAPWINVVANEEFGFLVSESGSGYSWSINSGENRLTTWRNDPVSDEPSEAIYLRDEETGEVWSPTPLPAPAPAPYLVRHGAGYSTFEHNSHGLSQHLRMVVAPDAPVKLLHLRLANTHHRTRRITVTYYAEWVLGVDRAMAEQFIIPEYVEDGFHALMAFNPYNVEFGERHAFVATSHRVVHGLTTDRTEFLGRCGSLERPAALDRVGLSNRVEPGLDSCAVIQLHVDLPPNGSEELCFLLGEGADRDEALHLLARYSDADATTTAWQAAKTQWDEMLGTIQVATPDPAMNLLLNRWLLYQALSCRIWGRSALYQSSGAYGFRDQLQDVMALVHARPDLTRAQILRSARHQFEAGDVLHWWHPPSGRGVRTRITDDLLWLPYVTAHYVSATGDRSILEEKAPFLQAKPLEKDEDERYAQYSHSEETFTLYEHCRRALQKGLTQGPHNLPYMGSGDWNDGMNRVGIHGQGESIWLGWFLNSTLHHFSALCDEIGQDKDAERYREQAHALQEALESHGWDGQWYRRAYYDDGTPLGSAENRECRIDSITQSWGVLSGAARSDRARQAMDAVLDQLVKWDDRLILLFTPPFDKTPHDPGYIKGYLPGIRENGGQYTHAALWTIWAFAELGDGDLAHALYSLINPIYRSSEPDKVEQYKVEPYVISADVYGVAPHIGRGGWTWYTGSSGWMYRLGIEGLLGIRRLGQELYVEPCIPKDWPGFTLVYRYGSTDYRVKVENPEAVCRGVKQVTLDDKTVSDGKVHLRDDGEPHMLKVLMGK